ncbi:MAG: hypothetical protein ACSHWN_03980 [Methylophilaceae bacterium]
MNNKRKNLKKLSRNQDINETQEQNLASLDYIKIFAFLLSISGVFLIVLGYGRITGLAAIFGLTALELVDDKTDFLYEAAVPLMQFYTQVVEMLSSSIFWTLILVFTGIFSILYIIIRCLRSSPEIRRNISSKVDRVGYFFESSAFDLGPVLGFIRAIVKILTEIFTFLSPIWYLLCVITLVLLVGLGGYYRGQKLAKDYIVYPNNCAGDLTGKSGKEKVAICVAVLNDGNEIARGRIIASTKERIFLYIKNEDNARITRSYPIHNAIIERVDTELSLPERINRVIENK